MASLFLGVLYFLILLNWLRLLTSVPSSDAPVVALTPLTATEYQQAAKAALTLMTPTTFPVRPRKGKLIIPTTTGKQVYRDVVINEVYRGKGSKTEEAAVYTYKGLLTNFQCHLVKVSYADAAQWWLIGRDGHRLVINGEPLYSPDDRTLATYNVGVKGDVDLPNTIQILRLQNGELQKFWSIYPAWEPHALFWTSRNTLCLKRNDNPGGDKPVFSYWKLTLTSAPQ